MVRKGEKIERGTQVGVYVTFVRREVVEKGLFIRLSRFLGTTLKFYEVAGEREPGSQS